MNKKTLQQLTILPTGIHEKKINNIEMAMPFHCVLYARYKSFHISLNGESNILDADQLIFIKKSTPFSVLLDWDENIDIVNDCLSLVIIPQEAVIEYCRKNGAIEYETNKFKTKPVFNYININDSSSKNSEIKLLRNIIESYRNNFANGVSYTKVDEAKYTLILSLIEELNPEVESVLLSNISLSTSDKVVGLVVSNYSRNWTSKELSYILHMSESAFKKKMYKETGSVSNFITKIKMIEALRLLRHTAQPVNVIAMLLGYNSPSYFTKIFKRYVGIYPSTLIKR
ncbi:helix-turn-helix domain-containing protein [Citrobacter freundii]|uniref:helix-turn-helix domain-containing protein n=1 Tax=Citrobacter freundii TaxID=546 RepID=UPI001EF11094|nr:helix-turn-helix domain-containing protein [Citrobacter freundii]